jgi:hypothetical protein
MPVPVFIEVLHSDKNLDLQICRKIMSQLFRRNVNPLPFASSIYELVDVLHVLRRMKHTPAIFIVNTYWAEDILRDLDAIVGDTPILLLDRRIVSTGGSVNNPLQDMELRKISRCLFGPKTSEQTAESVANALVKFLKDGEFWHIESLGGTSSMNLKPIS